MAEKILSCFIDEAGDFGEYDHHSPYYIVYVILHEQSDSIQQQIDELENYLSNLGYPNHALHTGPLIRREPPYEELFMEDRKKLFNLLFRFARKMPMESQKWLSFLIRPCNAGGGRTSVLPLFDNRVV